jgi:hypothetical protein
MGPLPSEAEGEELRAVAAEEEREMGSLARALRGGLRALLPSHTLCGSAAAAQREEGGEGPRGAAAGGAEGQRAREAAERKRPRRRRRQRPGEVLGERRLLLPRRC